MEQEGFPKLAAQEAYPRGGGASIGEKLGKTVQGGGNEKRKGSEAGQAWCFPGTRKGPSRLMRNEQGK